MTTIESAKKELLDEIKQISRENDDEPLYSSFVRWVCGNILNITDETDIEDAISLGGPNDYDVDFFIHNDEGDDYEQYMKWGQVKFSETFDYSVARNEMETFGKTIDYLTDCPQNANSMFKEKSKLFNDLGGKDASIRKRMYFIVAGDLNEQTKELLESSSWKRTIDNLRGPKIEFKVITIADILNHIITPRTDTLRIKFDGRILERTDELTQKESVVGYVKAKALADIVNNHPGLFGLNVRESLGKDKPTFKGMKETLDDPVLKQQFWKFNNGVTAVCDKLEKVGTNPSEFEIENFKIVNGRQTTYCLAQNEDLLDYVTIGLTIHAAKDIHEIDKISVSTNTQNPVKPVDLFSNDESINDLALQCRTQFHDYYFERQTRGFNALEPSTRIRITKKRLLDKNKTARAYLAYVDNPNSGIMSESKLFGIASPHFDQVFVGRKIKDLIVPHNFKQMLDGLDLKWTKEIKSGDNTHKRDKTILHKDIVKYFILHFLGTTMNEFSDEEKDKIETKIIKEMTVLKNKDSIPQGFLNVASTGFNYFMFLFNLNKNITWEDELYTRITKPGYEPRHEDIPTDFEVMRRLKLSGPLIKQTLLNSRSDLIDQDNVDPIKQILSDYLDE